MYGAMLQEEYVEYSRHGTIIKGQEKACVKSRYDEDVYINNHKVGCFNIVNLWAKLISANK